MKSVTLKIPDSLDRRIRAALAKRKETFSAMARRALVRELEMQEVDFAELADRYKGVHEGPASLSEREGYG